MSYQSIMRARLCPYVRDGWKRARVAMTCLTVSSLANAAEPNWSLSADQELRYASWSGTRGFPASGSTAAGAGTQVYAPLTIQASGQPLENLKVDLFGRGGYVWSRQSTPGLTGSVTTT